MSTHNDRPQKPADIEALLSTTPALRDQGFSQRVLRRTHQYRQRRSLFLGLVWLMAVTCVTLAFASLGLGDSLLAFVQQAGGLLSQLDVAPIQNAELTLLSFLQNTTMLVFAAVLLLVVVFASTSILD